MTLAREQGILPASGWAAATDNIPEVRRLLRQIVLFLVLFLFWTALSGQVDLREVHPRYLVGCGVVSCLIGTAVASRTGFLYDEGDFFGIALRQIPYLAWLGGQIVLSNVDVAKRVWRRRLEIEPEWIRFPYETGTDLTTVIFANSITLTPGTVTVLIDEDRREVLVHALTGGKAEGIRAMHDRVLALERGLEAHDRPESDRRGDTVPEENESGPRDRARADADDGAKHRETGGES